jgi:membrane associated rhomboid family serine protease
MAVDVCGRCKALVRSDQRRCHRCGRFAPALFGARKWFDLLFQSPIDHSRVLMVVLAVVYAFELWATHRWPDEGQRPGLSLSPGFESLRLLGALFDWRYSREEPWRLLTCCLLHGNLLHLLFNGSSLMVAGPYVEQLFGRARFWIVFVLTGLGGSVAWLVAQAIALRHGDESAGVCVGASGAIFGFIGTMIAWGVRHGGSMGRLVRDYALRWLVFGIAFSIAGPNVALSAHVGGAVTGFAIGWFFELPTTRGGRESDLARFGGLGSIVLLVACAVAMACADVAELAHRG